jgi:hypothetical protein
MIKIKGACNFVGFFFKHKSNFLTMKKILILVSFIIAATSGFSQIKIITENGDTIHTEKVRIFDKSLSYENSQSVSLKDIEEVIGNISKHQCKLISKKSSADFKRSPDSDYRKINVVIYEFKVNRDAGDYLMQTGNEYLLGTALSLGGGLVITGSSFFDNSTFRTLGIATGSASMLAGICLFIDGHSKLKKAGKILHDQKKLSLQPSSTGIGICMRF